MLEDYWYIACRSKNLRRRPLALTIMGQHLALFRGQAGEVAALQDRCAHRNAPLSQGRICEDSLQCPYHGWRYNRQGEVVEIPALAQRQGVDFPAGIKSFPCVEQQGYVWVCLSTQTAQSAPTKFARLNQSGWTSFHMQTRFGAPVEACLENFLDCPHATHVHSGWFRSRSQRELRASVQMLEDGAQAEYFDEPRERSLVWSLLSPKKADMQHIDRFIAPATTRVDYRFSNGMQYIITSSCTPIDECTTEVFTVISFRIKWVGWLVRLYFEPLARQIIKQDVAMLSAQQQNIMNFGGPEFEVVEPDLLHNGIRQWRTALKNGSTPPVIRESRDVKLRL
jgi:phenylpropionate dioxygenase-like ring-hydroxylating dioxygenase large terminal subunit